MVAPQFEFGYKVVSSEVIRGRLVYKPCTPSGLRNYEYRIGKITSRKPNSGPMAVFKSECDAFEFWRNYVRYALGDFVIFRVKYIPSCDKLLYRLSRPSSRVSCTQVSLNGRKVYGLYLGFTPAGTALADQVYPLSIVDTP